MLLEMIPIFAVSGTALVSSISSTAPFADTSAGRPNVNRFLPDALNSSLYPMSPEMNGVLLSTLMHPIADVWYPLPLITRNGLLSWVASVHTRSNEVGSIGSHPTWIKLTFRPLIGP